MKKIITLFIFLSCCAKTTLSCSSSDKEKIMAHRLRVIEIIQERVWDEIATREEYLKLAKEKDFKQHMLAQAKICNQNIDLGNYHIAVIQNLPLQIIKKLDCAKFKCSHYTNNFCNQATVYVFKQPPQNFTAQQKFIMEEIKHKHDVFKKPF